MIKRFVIAGLIMGALVGAVWWFNFSFKPQMIADFMSKMKPPAASVTAEPAKLERWSDRVHAVGTLDATQGLWIAPEVGGIVSEYYFDSGQDVEEGQRLVQLDIAVEEGSSEIIGVPNGERLCVATCYVCSRNSDGPLCKKC